LNALYEWTILTLSISDPGQLTQRQLESTLWSAANALRGPVDPGDFKAYVFPVMFFKWISDSWDHEHALVISAPATLKPTSIH
jgi:type I restriction enzyme M protein